MARIPKTALVKIPGVRKGPMPRTIEPMKATLVDDPFSREGWIFENKYDGVRAICRVAEGRVQLVSRNQKDMTIKYPELKDLPEWVDADEAILDGEIVVLDKKGDADFQELQARFGLTNLREIERLRKTQIVVLYAFDLIYLDGFNLMGASLLDRKALLRKIIRKRKSFQFAEHVATNGEKLFARAERLHLEGIIAKNAFSTYEQRRSNEWLKIKTVMRQEAVICGYTAPQGSREFFGALHLGLYQGKELVSVGKVGSGFDRTKLKAIFDKMKPLRTDHHPFARTPKEKTRWRSSETVQWLKPKLVCEVRFSERTGDGSFRHPVFEGLRFDKKPTECKYEPEHDVSGEVTAAERRAKRARTGSTRTASKTTKRTTKARTKKPRATTTGATTAGATKVRATKAKAPVKRMTTRRKSAAKKLRS